MVTFLHSCIRLLFFALPVLSDTCASLASSGIHIATAPSESYHEENQEYWSTACAALKPSCILFPTTAEQVSSIVEVLLQNNDTFAVKAGGHNPNRYFASIEDGPLIATSDLTEVIYDQTTNTVRVGSGSRWDDVSAALEGTGVTVVGGRIGNVGVGGYILGAGLSFLSAEYGWAASNVVAFEMVLPNASVTAVTMQSDPDLFKALKGGGNLYGIITTYVLEAHPIGPIWGGNYVFAANNETTTALLAAVRDFTEYYPDEKAGIILTAEFSGSGTIDTWIMFLFYDGPSPRSGVFDNFTAVGPLVNDCRTRDYSELLTSNNWAVLEDSVYTIATETTPLPNATVGLVVLGAYYDHWRSVAVENQFVPGVVASLAIQPMPKGIAKVARDRGGDLLDLDPGADLLIFEYDFSYWSQNDDAKIDEANKALYGGMRALIDGFVTEGLIEDVYQPLFMNDGYFRQDYFGRLRETSRSLAVNVQQRVDPNGFFRTRTGGFKI